MLNVICVNADNYLGRGPEYVSKLVEGIRGNYSGRFSFRCMTEFGAPKGIAGWWHKIRLFEPGRFKGRCFYFDLDTVFTGPIDDILAYDGDFACISDFYHPSELQSAIMAWDADKCGDIYTKWRDVGFPQFHPKGDGGWIGQMRPDADVLQDLFPNRIVSFKADCLDGVPEMASVVCFHGKPRPHVLGDLMSHW